MRVASAPLRCLQPVLGAIALLVCSATWVAASPTYSITDLGTLPGQSESVATGINAQGEIVGVSANAIDNVGNAWPRVNPQDNLGVSSFLYGGGHMTQINPIGGSPANAINNAGQVVGGFNSSINNSGQYVNGNSLVSGGTTTSLGNFGADAINDSGAIAGVYHPQGLSGPADPAIYQGGHVMDLLQASSLNGVSGEAYAINNAGDALFYYMEKNGQTHYMLYSHDGHVSSMPLGDIVGVGGPGLPAALNNVGQVVGDNFLYSSGHTYILTDLIPANSKWGDLVALAINDAGQIVGAGDINGNAHAFLMTPVPSQEVPEPSTIAIAAMASAWLLARQRRGRRGV